LCARCELGGEVQRNRVQTFCTQLCTAQADRQSLPPLLSRKPVSASIDYLGCRHSAPAATSRAVCAPRRTEWVEIQTSVYGKAAPPVNTYTRNISTLYMERCARKSNRVTACARTLLSRGCAASAPQRTAVARWRRCHCVSTREERRGEHW
jgi:hypothetical protein